MSEDSIFAKIGAELGRKRAAGPQRDVEYFELSPVAYDHPEPGEFRIASAALITCGLCSKIISGNGGPGDGAICKPCGDALRRGELRGAVVWDRPTTDGGGKNG